MKLIIILLGVCVSLSGPTTSAANFFNQGCTKKWYEDFAGVIHNVSIFPEDNRGRLRVRGPEEGLLAHDIQKAEENIVMIYCPSRTKGKFEGIGGAFIGSNDQIVTNIHAFVEDDGSVNDRLSECVYRFVGLTDGRGAIDHPLNLKDGAEGLKQLRAMNSIRSGNYPADLTDDYVVIKLKNAVTWVRAYQVAPVPIKFHGCKENQICQQMVSISPYQDRMKTKITSGSALVLQTSNLRGVLEGSNGHGTTLFSNTSGTLGSSGSLQFLRDDGGTLVRGSDGELLPISILARSMDKSFDGKAYSSKDNIYSLSVALDGKALSDIQTLAGKSQTAEVPDDASLPSNNDGN